MEKGEVSIRRGKLQWSVIKMTTVDRGCVEVTTSNNNLFRKMRGERSPWQVGRGTWGPPAEDGSMASYWTPEDVLCGFLKPMP